MLAAVAMTLQRWPIVGRRSELELFEQALGSAELEGLLIHGHRRLSQDVRGQGVRSAYVFRCAAADVPRIEARKPRKRLGGVGDVFAV